MRRLIAALATLATAGCATTPAERAETAAGIAAAAGLRPLTVEGRPFALAAFARNPDAGQPVTVYIEGDGLAWITPSRPSTDPTPRDPVGLRLAARDGGRNVVYLARPCQYVWSPACREAVWTDRRFAEDVVAAMSAALDRLAHPGQAIHLVGYSGGGAVAALLAARRGDVASLRTAAGNLDHDAVNRSHGVSPMPGSLNPIDVAGRLARLPQIHYVGESDRVVPPWVADQFVRRQGQGGCATVHRLAGVGHAEGWAQAWGSLAATEPRCG